MPVEEVLVVGQRVVVTQVGDRLVRVAVAQPAQPSVRQPLERPPQYFVLDATHVYAHTPVERLRPHYNKRLGRQRRQGPAMQPAVQLLSVRRRGRWWLLGAREPRRVLRLLVVEAAADSRCRLRRGGGGGGGCCHGGHGCPSHHLAVRLCGGRCGRRGPSHGRADWWQTRVTAAAASIGFVESGARIAFRGHQPDTGPSAVNFLPPIRLRKQ